MIRPARSLRYLGEKHRPIQLKDFLVDARIDPDETLVMRQHADREEAARRIKTVGC